MRAAEACAPAFSRDFDVEGFDRAGRCAQRGPTHGHRHRPRMRVITLEDDRYLPCHPGAGNRGNLPRSLLEPIALLDVKLHITHRAILEWRGTTVADRGQRSAERHGVA